ncbi:hypothetical protein IM725_14720 [Ramlibacter aquaticus]|uniref:Uncharacterized protein n=1 Tax=Ramlibacter aquaticus TaxID=2780094 RepID=A0ABR9SHK1_9BURK|nr:hypothetical protein [Ramlibacter aquaticus]
MPSGKAAKPATAARPARAAASPAPLPVALTRSTAPSPTRAIPVAKAETPEPKARKPKLVRDSFTIPKDEYAALDVLKARSARLGRAMKKSEVLRAGLKALSAMADSTFLAALREVPAIKTGRPSSK